MVCCSDIRRGLVGPVGDCWFMQEYSDYDIYSRDGNLVNTRLTITPTPYLEYVPCDVAAYKP